MAKSIPTPKAQHHHGDLRNALVQAGLDILDTEGMDALTLRKAAARAGVSHAAPAHHFGDKEGLLVAIATHGFEVFTATMLNERYKTGDGPQQQLEGICRGYLRFSNERPALFRLIFSLPYKEHLDPALQTASVNAYMVLAEVCALFEPSPHGPGVNELRVWSAVHGYASLALTGRGNTRPGGNPVKLEWLIPELTPLQPK